MLVTIFSSHVITEFAFLGGVGVGVAILHLFTELNYKYNSVSKFLKASKFFKSLVQSTHCF